MILPIRYVIFSTPFRILAIFFQPREELYFKGHCEKGGIGFGFGFATLVHVHENNSAVLDSPAGPPGDGPGSWVHGQDPGPGLMDPGPGISSEDILTSKYELPSSNHWPDI